MHVMIECFSLEAVHLFDVLNPCIGYLLSRGQCCQHMSQVCKGERQVSNTVEGGGLASNTGGEGVSNTVGGR